MEIPPRQRGVVVRMAFLIELVYLVIGVVAIGLVKISVIYFYRRIFSTPKFKLLCNVYIAILILWTITMFIALLSQCGAHLPALFTINGFFRYCHASHPIGYAFVTSDCITDFITVCLPIPMVGSQILSHRTWSFSHRARLLLLLLLPFAAGSIRSNAKVVSFRRFWDFTLQPSAKC